MSAIMVGVMRRLASRQSPRSTRSLSAGTRHDLRARRCRVCSRLGQAAADDDFVRIDDEDGSSDAGGQVVDELRCVDGLAGGQGVADLVPASGFQVADLARGTVPALADLPVDQDADRDQMPGEDVDDLDVGGGPTPVLGQCAELDVVAGENRP